MALVLPLLTAGLGCDERTPTPEKSSMASMPPGGRQEPEMNIVNITPDEAKKLLDTGGFVYLDVRTVPEFVNGHAPAAWNVPVAEMNPATGRMEPSDKFQGVVEKHFPRDAHLVVGCKTGGRSAAACEILAKAGYKNLRNVDGGFMGVTDPNGQVVKEGWSTLGYPVERGDGGEKSYESLRKNAP